MSKVLDFLRYTKNIAFHVRSLSDRIEHLRADLELFASRQDVDDDLFDRFHAAKATAEYRRPYEAAEPLVSVCIGTYNRARLLTERALTSVLSQDYRRLEVIVVGDACNDDTAGRIRALGDDRVRFFNFPERGRYPADPRRRWMVAGTTTFNEALRLAQGDFVTHLDDDDEFLPGRIQKLVSFLRETGADLVWHPFWKETEKGFGLIEAPTFAKTQVTTSSVLYHHWLREIPWDVRAHQYHEPGDWNRFRKIRYLGADVRRFPEPLLRHYREQRQTG